MVVLSFYFFLAKKQCPMVCKNSEIPYIYKKNNKISSNLQAKIGAILFITEAVKIYFKTFFRKKLKN